MNNKQALLFAITKALSERSESVKERLMTLEEWCLIINPAYWDVVVKFCSIYEDTWNTYTLSHMNQDNEMTEEIFDYLSIEQSKIKILWRYPQWSDIIEVLGKSWYMNRNSIWGTIPVDWSFKYIEIKLSHWYPEHQNEETLEEVLKLIKET